jgi:antitoxin Phd
MNYMYRREIKMYSSEMSKISVTDARGQLPELIERARSEAVFVERRGKVEAVLISPEQYARMLDALEDAEDVAAFDEAMAEEGENIPWAQVKADLGWE